MAFIATANNDNWTVPQYGEINLTVIDGLGGIDTLSFGPLSQSRFSITQDSAGIVTIASVSGASSTFYYKLKNVEFLSFNGGASKIDLSTYFGAPVTDVVAPTVTSFSPADAATGVAVNANIVLTFSEAVQKGTGVIEIHSGSATGTLLEFMNVSSANVTVSGSTVTINPTSTLANGTQYFVTFASGAIKDIAGNAYAGTTTYDFTTVAAPVTDVVAPTVTSFSPADAATGVAVNANIVLTFSEAVTVGAGLIGLRDLSGAVIESFNVLNHPNISVSGAVVTINPSIDLSNGSLYTVHLDSGAVVDLAGNALQTNVDFMFGTAVASTTNTSSDDDSDDEFISHLVPNLVLSRDKASNTLSGLSGNDTIDGAAGNDVLSGMAGNDVLIGGLGNDILTGGLGNDTFRFNSMPKASTNKDTITDFTHGQDFFELSQAIFTRLSVNDIGSTIASEEFLSGAGVKAATTTSQHIIYNSSTGALYYDADGVGRIAAIQIALVGTTTHPDLTYDDFHVII